MTTKIMTQLEEKVEQSKEIIEHAVNIYSRIGVACSFGKDSMVTVDLARKVCPSIPIFSVMTPYKPLESFTYIQEVDALLNLNVTVHFAGEEAPEELKFLGDRLILHPDLSKKAKKYREELNHNLKQKFGENTSDIDLCTIAPSLCCDLFKTEVTKRAVKYLEAWVCGLRKDEGRTRINYSYAEKMGSLTKINPIINFSEEDVFEYLRENNIPLHPWYEKQFPDGKKYRSLGCSPCTVPIFPHQKERDGRWIGTSKCGGECGIHTQILRGHGEGI